ncbi:hypothetical protein [Bacillus mycoides]|uniref:hypothetical protein n=1 Tax=Bacillus mycoides TaxID=1405 RepID=UPI0025A00AB1|nr:hypothetical protein [Bacillus mycoides]MDM5431129.1 hypothetical protein [Bacillus mycoides]
MVDDYRPIEIVQKPSEISRLGRNGGTQLIFSQAGGQLVVDAQNPNRKISSLNEREWKVLVDGVEKHIFSETTTAKERLNAYLILSNFIVLSSSLCV